MGANILVVEDNLLNRQLLRAILQYRGHRVLEAASVDEARARLAEVRLDVVLLDVQIPGGGGEALLQTLRANPTLASVPVVAVTAAAMQGDRERLLAAGFDGYVSRPVDTRAFGPLVEEWIVHGRGD